MHEELPRKLNDDESRAAVLYLANKWGDPCQCPYCKPVKWTVSDELATIPFSALDNSAYFMAVQCVNCRNTVFIDVVRAGIIKEESDE